MNQRLKYLAIVLLFIVGCSTEPPTETPPFTLVTGKIFVSSNISGASIFVNGASSGKTTPDTISVPAGNVTIRIEKEGHIPASSDVLVIANQTVSLMITLAVQTTPKIVLLEEFSNVSCGPCVNTNIILGKLPESGYDKSKLVIVKYSASYPSPQDPHYLHAKADFDARMVYYSVFSTPSLYVDGNVSPIASDSNSIKSAVAAKLAKTPEFRITLKDSIHNGEFRMGFIVTNLDSSNIKFSDLVIHTLVVENQITYATPPGSNGETSFKNVVRKMLPSKDGESLTSLNILQSVAYSRSVPLHSAWNTANLRSVIFIQNKVTKEVYQTTSSY